MDKITKKEFITALTENNSIFFGMTKQLACRDEIEIYLDDFDNDNRIVEERSAKAHSNCLEFSGGSRLYFDQKGGYSFHKMVYGKHSVYVCMEYANTENPKCMYYMVNVA